MEDTPVLESWLRKLLSPIINKAVDKAISRHFSSPAPLPPDQNDLWDVKRAAEFLLLSVPTIYGLVHKRSIPHYKKGKRLYFVKCELIKWVFESKRKTFIEINQDIEGFLHRTSRRH